MAVSVGAGQESGIGNSESLWVMILKGCLGNIGARSAAPGTFEDSLVQSQSGVGGREGEGRDGEAKLLGGGVRAVGRGAGTHCGGIPRALIRGRRLCGRWFAITAMWCGQSRKTTPASGNDTRRGVCPRRSGPGFAFTVPIKADAPSWKPMARRCLNAIHGNNQKQ